MKVALICFLLLMTCMYPSLAQGYYENCCLRYSKEINPKIKKRVMSYRIQETDGACNIPAIIFRMKKANKTFCADPNQTWVKNLMKIKKLETNGTDR